jgi:hypothetical protein
MEKRVLLVQLEQQVLQVHSALKGSLAQMVLMELTVKMAQMELTELMA